jgi:hypothetical protein
MGVFLCSSITGFLTVKSILSTGQVSLAVTETYYKYKTFRLKTTPATELVRWVIKILAAKSLREIAANVEWYKAILFGGC